MDTSSPRTSSAEALGPIAAVDDISIRAVRYFLTVAETGSVSAAAGLLGVPQPTLSQQIKRLEQRVGFALFTRNGRGLVLTAAGEAFGSRVALIPLQIRDAIEAARPAPAAAILHLGVCPGVAYTRIESLTDDLRFDYMTAIKDPQVRVLTMSTSELTAGMKKGQITFAVVRLPFSDKDTAHASFRSDNLGVVVHRTHPLARRDWLTWAHLSGHDLLRLDSNPHETEPGALLPELHRRGWFPQVVKVDDDHPVVLTHTLAARPSTVMLTAHDDLPEPREMRWIPVASDPIVETLALAASKNSCALISLDLAKRAPSPRHRNSKRGGLTTET